MNYLQLIDTISQFGLAVFGILAIILVSRKNKWGFVFGLLSQPFWFATSIINEQWGVFALSFIYLGSWMYGIYEWFFKEKILLNIANELNQIEENPEHMAHLSKLKLDKRARRLRWALRVLSPSKTSGGKLMKRLVAWMAGGAVVACLVFAIAALLSGSKISPVGYFYITWVGIILGALFSTNTKTR